jgi:hypothetical protein
MINIDEILSHAEDDLRHSGTVSSATCQAFLHSRKAMRRGLEAVFTFLGCSNDDTAPGKKAVSQTQRIRAIRLMLLKLRAHTQSPQWSSLILETMFEAALQSLGAQIGDIVQALFGVLAESSGGLSEIQTHFIREIGIQVVGRHRREYASQDFSWLASAVMNPNADLTAAQAYLAAYVLPPSLVPECRKAILAALQSTQFVDEVAQLLQD